MIIKLKKDTLCLEALDKWFLYILLVLVLGMYHIIISSKVVIIKMIFL
jgi:hypothetical protein